MVSRRQGSVGLFRSLYDADGLSGRRDDGIHVRGCHRDQLSVHVYALGYMHGDVRYKRYYAILSLFTASMLGLVLADNFLLLFIFWELMGLCSFLLIGHWYEKQDSATRP